jgi:hypothetical protein
MKILLLVTFGLMTSCAVTVKTPVSRNLSPEIQGHGDVAWNAGFSGATNVRVNTANDQLNNPMDYSNDFSSNLVNLEIGIKNRVDIVYGVPGKSPSILGVKIKLMGESRVNAKKGNQALSLLLAAGGRQEETTDELFTRATARAESTATVLGLLYGYRISDQTLLGSSLMIDSYNIKGEFVAGKNANLVGQNFNFDGTVTNLNLFAIFYYQNSKWFNRIEIGLQQLDWDNTAKKSIGLSAFSIGRTF